MPAPERRALLLLLGLALTGHAIRRLWLEPGAPPGSISLMAAGGNSPAAHRDSAAAGARPLAPGERIDVDRAPAHELARLPRIGPALARRIVADREANGAFGGIAGLDRVPGVGPGLLKILEPRVEFGGGTGQAGSPAASPSAGAGPPDINHADSSALVHLPGIGPGLAGRIVRYRERHGSFVSVDSLLRVPGIGPATVARIRAVVEAH